MNKSFRILVISSCTKSKSVTNDHNITWDDLDSPEKRKRIKETYSKRSVEACQLYSGRQMKLILEGIGLLRSRAIVDHFVISAGFGLISENEKIPSYDASFSSLSKNRIQILSKNLKIKETWSQLDFPYDLVFLALGKDYLNSIFPFIKQNLSKEVIHFNRDTISQPEMVQVFETPLRGKRDKKYLPYGVENSMNAKGGILLNFAHWISEDKNELYPGIFQKYWNELSLHYNLDR